MIETQNSSISPKKRTIVEYALLALCLCVLALRATFTEGPAAITTSLPGNIGDTAYSISLSAVLIFCCIFYFLWSFPAKRGLFYRVTGIELGLFVFCIACVASGLVAADKRLAVTSAITLLAGPFMAVFLVQLLDRHSTIGLVLCVIAALGTVTTSESVYQLLVTNQATIEQYEQAPQSLLEPLGIEPGSFQQFLFEHRLYTGGARGFFTTRNSAGCFSLMAVFAAFTLLINKLNWKNPAINRGAKYLAPQSFDLAQACPEQSRGDRFIGGFLVLTVVILGLILTKSKGSIISLLFAVLLLLIYHFFADRLKAHKKAVLAAGVLLFAAGISLAASYGLKYGRLPGGVGMLVRWQYWHASAKMYAEHPLAGVGPGNFTHFYPRYKEASALESVADPHNFLLSVLTQYGPIGLVGFLFMILMPLWRAIFPAHIKDEGQRTMDDGRVPAIVSLTIVSTVLLLVRPVIMPMPPADTMELWIFMAVTMYVTPVAVFIASSWLLCTAFSKNTKYFIPILFCVVLGVLLNNLIDYAIFEPGIYTAFWAIIACLIAADSQCNPRPVVVLRPGFYAKVMAAAAGIVILGAFVLFAWRPVCKSTAKIRQAQLALSAGHLQQAHDLLSKAAEYNPLDQTALNIAGRLYMQSAQTENSVEGTKLLKKAEQCFLQAIGRNKADFKNYEKLASVYELLGQTQKAYQWCRRALQLYPGLDRLNFKLAHLAEQLGHSDIALVYYSRTIEIEDSYRRQFKMIYPDRKEIISRLGEEKYQYAIKRVKELSEKTNTE
ncbi:MAG: O-antigen ligase family protein [Sedimentisphaerales bacterium]|nr:O-antigen ligase family protein [Sedimentisphaerales bacterium]